MNGFTGAIILGGLIWVASKAKPGALAAPAGAFAAPSVAAEAVEAFAAQEGLTEEEARLELQEAAIVAGTGPRFTIPGAPAFSSHEEEAAYILWAYTQAGIDYNAWVAGEVGVSAMTDARLAQSQEILETQVTLGETQPWLAEQAEKQLVEINSQIALRAATEPAFQGGGGGGEWEAEAAPAPAPAASDLTYAEQIAADIASQYQAPAAAPAPAAPAPAPAAPPAPYGGWVAPW